MKKIEVVVLETGPDYLDKVEGFLMEVSEDRSQAVAKAIRTVEDLGYEVLHNNQGGNNEYVKIGCEKEYIAITIVPKVEEGKE